MLSCVKSLIAVALAALVALGAGVWSQNRSAILQSLRKEQRDLETRVAQAKGYATTASCLQTRLGTLQQNIEDITGRLAGKDFGGPQLVKAVVETAAASGMVMSAAAEAASMNRVLAVKGTEAAVNLISYDLRLKGAYSGLVEFLQKVAAWELETRIESMEISPAEENERPGMIAIRLVLNIFARNKT